MLVKDGPGPAQSQVRELARLDLDEVERLALQQLIKSHLHRPGMQLAKMEGLARDE